MTRMVDVTICGIPSKVPRAYYRWVSYLAGVPPHVYRADLEEGRQHRRTPAYLDYWEQLEKGQE